MTVDLYPWLTTRYTNARSTVPNLHQQIDSWLGQHSNNSITSRSATTYANDIERLAYCVAHFPVGVKVVSKELQEPNKMTFPSTASVFLDGLDVISLGCGPGSDMVGALKSFGAVPKNLTLKGTDIEAGWEPWARDAVTEAISADPMLSSIKPKFSFSQLNLNDPSATREYLRQNKPSNMGLYVLHRVLGTLDHKEALMNLFLDEDVISQEAMLLVVAPRRDFYLLKIFAEILDQSPRRGSRKLKEYGNLTHHGWEVPQDLWKDLKHKPETSAKYSVLRYNLDVATTVKTSTSKPVEPPQAED